MIATFPATGRGSFDHGWLKTHHSFSFAEWHDPGRVQFSALRVLNDDVIAPAMGFGTHPHRDMEILTWVLSGHLQHQDSMGHGGRVSSGGVQYMSAGTGVHHSEVNPDGTVPLHLLQVWILPARAGLRPRYGQRDARPDELVAGWVQLAGPDPEVVPQPGPMPTSVAPLGEGVIPIRQDARLSATRLAAGGTCDLEVAEGRRGYLHLALGSATCAGHDLVAGDALGFADAERATLVAGPNGAEALWFDLP
ncbi:MAG: pirin family protein [Candidatus Sericytochromatia bacterium]|nr:pirin family protein [Candidatus Tanganyikabacteria bacterium]